MLAAVAVCLAVGLLVGLLPAARLTRTPLAPELRASGRTGAAGLGQRAQRALVVTELALSVTVMVGALLLARSFVNLQRTDLGFSTGDVVTMTVGIPSGASRTDAQATRFFAQLIERVRAQPGVEAAGALSSVPLAGSPPPDDFLIEGRREARPSEPGFNAHYVMATPGVFEALGARLIRGRAIEPADTSLDAPVAVVNERFARSFWPDGDPIGKRIRYPTAIDGDRWTSWTPWITIVGLVGDMRTIRPSDPPREAIYVSHAQRPRAPYDGRSMGLLVRTSAGAPVALAAVRSIARELDELALVSPARPLDRVLGAAVARPRFLSTLMGVFAVVSLAIAALGMHGLVACGVARRTREIGVRMALGASSGSIAGLVGRQVGLMLAAGLGVGLAGAAGLTRWMSALLFGVQPFDGVTYAAVTGLLALAVAVAAMVPARRAMRVDPLVALRAE
jgi:putative ABC transport system permease protein